MQIRKSALFWTIFKLNRVLSAASIGLALLVGLLEVASNALVLPLTQILGGTTASLPATVKDTNAGFYLQQGFSTIPESWHLPALLLTLLLLTAVKNASLYASSLSINAFMLRSGAVLREKCLKRFLALEVSFYNNTDTGRLLGYTNEQAQRSELLFSALLEFVREALFIALLVGFLVVLSPLLTVITCISLLLVAFLLRFVIRGVHHYGRKTSSDLEAFSSLVAEMLSGIRVIKSFSSEKRELSRSMQALQQRYKSELAAYKFNSAVAPLTEAAGVAILLFIVLTGSFVLGDRKDTSLPLLLTYALALLRTIPRVNHINGLRSRLSLLWGSFESIENFLLETASQSLVEGNKPYRSFESCVSFTSLTFTYPGSVEPAIREINLTIEKGKTTALVGQSGSGKSTLTDLFLRFYDPDAGCVLVDGVDLRCFDRRTWHQAIAVVSQDTFLFNTTVRDNIAYGVPQATDREIVEAARKAHAVEFIEGLPCGFDTVVGNRGTLLSGGQRQRIAIARAILCDPDILILDEATSALDTQSERIVQKAIAAVSEQRTVVVVAHRLSTIERADKIVVLQNGAILEQGSHTELMADRGAYYALSRLQSGATPSLSSIS